MRLFYMYIHSYAGDAEPVSVTLFGESICPYCAKFTTEIAAPLFKQPGLTDIFNFSYVAFGNALNSTEVHSLGTSIHLIGGVATGQQGCFRDPHAAS